MYIHVSEAFRGACNTCSPDNGHSLPLLAQDGSPQGHDDRELKRSSRCQVFDAGDERCFVLSPSLHPCQLGAAAQAGASRQFIERDLMPGATSHSIRDKSTKATTVQISERGCRNAGDGERRKFAVGRRQRATFVRTCHCQRPMLTLYLVLTQPEQWVFPTRDFDCEDRRNQGAKGLNAVRSVPTEPKKESGAT